MSSVGDQIRMDWLLDTLKGKDISNLTIIFGTCKDCKYYFDASKDNNIGNIYKTSYCRKHGKNIHREDFYCADFEKRGNENGNK